MNWPKNLKSSYQRKMIKQQENMVSQKLESETDI